jgi:hypothetical protein
MSQKKAKVLYRFVPGSSMTGDAQKVGEALAEIASRHGGQLTEQAILGAAKDPSSPLHGYFEWDDKKAAAKWREQQLAAWQPGHKERN